MKKIYLLLFLIFSIGVYSQNIARGSNHASKINQNQQSIDFDLIVKSLQKSKEFLNIISTNDKKNCY